jgi:hypothetical protein
LRIAALAVCATLSCALAQDRAPAAAGEAWRTSPFHRVINDATGRPIPCLCRFRGQDYRVGDAVCMSTHVGTVIARCDLSLNNTTWVPTGEPCALSMFPRAPAQTMSRAAPG